MSAECRQANAEADERNRLRAEIERLGGELAHLRSICLRRPVREVDETWDDWDTRLAEWHHAIDAAGRGDGVEQVLKEEIK
jgi:hypothetical protein